MFKSFSGSLSYLFAC